MGSQIRVSRSLTVTGPSGFKFFFPVYIGLLLGVTSTIFGFNSIHEASYNLVPRSNFKSATTLSAGAIVRSQETDVYEMPLGIALEATPRVELGARIQTRWGQVEDNVPYMVFGVKWLTLRNTTVQADLLVGTNFNTGKGFSFSSHHKFNYASWLYSRLAARIGFMEALTDEDALASIELAYHPTLVLARTLRLECGLIGSSQTQNFEKNLAIDIQPAMNVNFGRDSELVTAVAFGLAGNRQEEMRVKVVINHGI
jgi:hypothetical protein